MIPRLADPIFVRFLNELICRRSPLDKCAQVAYPPGDKANNHAPLLVCHKTDNEPQWDMFVFSNYTSMPYGVVMPTCPFCDVLLDLSSSSKTPKLINVKCKKLGCQSEFKIKRPGSAQRVDSLRNDVFRVPFPYTEKLALKLNHSKPFGLPMPACPSCQQTLVIINASVALEAIRKRCQMGCNGICIAKCEEGCRRPCISKCESTCQRPYIAKCREECNTLFIMKAARAVGGVDLQAIGVQHGEGAVEIL